MKVACDYCGSELKRSPAAFNVRGAKRNFCNFQCLGSFRKSQTGTSAHRYRHGGKGTRLYRVWKGMKTRCFNPRSPNYKWYGARGISVCPDWAGSFDIFKSWALQSGYADNLEIDRINNDGNYSPSNCRFVTDAVNRRNSPTFKRTPITVQTIYAMVAVGDMSYDQIAHILGVSKSTVYRTIRDSKHHSK